MLEELIEVYKKENFEKLPILCVGIQIRDGMDMMQLYCDYQEYFNHIEYKRKESNKTFYLVGKEIMDYDIMMKYDIDKNTHLRNAFAYKKFKEEEYVEGNRKT